MPTNAEAEETPICRIGADVPELAEVIVKFVWSENTDSGHFLDEFLCC